MKSKRFWLLTGMGILLAFLGFNWVAFNHAKRMTQFVPTGDRTKSPEDLSTIEKLPLLIFGITVPRPQNDQTPADLGLMHQIVMIESDQHQLEGWHIQATKAPSLGTVILLHGYSASKTQLLTETLAIHEMGYDALLVDFRGSGGSTGNETTIGYAEAEDVAAAFQFTVDQNLPQPVFLYGVSMGGAAVMRAVATTEIEPNGIIVEAVFDEMLTTVENRFDTMGVPAFPAAQLLVFWGGVQHGFNGFEHNPADYAEQIEVPVLMLHGSNDPRATLAEGQHIFDRLAAEQKTIIIFDGAEHESTIGVDPDLWQQSVRSFLEETK
ncbi:MAG: alpha/beta fold hydrolase [Chloroflexota bacterium]